MSRALNAGFLLVEIRDARPAPRKNGPAPQKLTKPAGRDRAKLTVDYTDYAHTFGLRVGK